MEMNHGQSAVVDAALIAPILVLILLVGNMISATNTNTFFLERNEKRFAEDLTYSLLKSTIRYVTYEDSSGNHIVLEDKTVEHLISEDLYLREKGNVNIATLKSGLEDKIDSILKNLTYPNYDYSLRAEYKNSKFLIGSDTLPTTRMSYTTYIDMPDNKDKAKLTLYVWRVR